MERSYQYQHAWPALVNKAFDDFDSLTSDERIWFTVQDLMQAVDDGGLVSYYYNSGADHIDDCLAALEVLEMPSVAKLLEEMNGLFPRSALRDQDRRNAAIDRWPGSVEARLSALDAAFGELAGQLDEALARFIENKGLARR